MKKVYLPNFVPTSEAELVSAVHAAAMRINDEHHLPFCFNNAALPP